MIKTDLMEMELRDELRHIYRGVVENNNDPLQAGRVQIRIFGLHSPSKIKTATDGIPTEELPWAEPAISLIEGAISSYGFFGVPLQGSHVFLFFEAGHINRPVYFAAAPAIPATAPDSALGFNDPDGVYPDAVGQPDWYAGLGTYPHVITLKTHGGHIIEVDSTPGAIRYRIYHPSGTVSVVDNDGNLDVTIVKNRTTSITNDETLVISNNRTTNITGSDSLTIGSGLTINITGACSVTASGAVTISSPDVDIGTGTTKMLLNETAAVIYNSHTHGGDSTPNQKIEVSGSGMTSVTKAS